MNRQTRGAGHGPAPLVCVQSLQMSPQSFILGDVGFSYSLVPPFLACGADAAMRFSVMTTIPSTLGFK